MWYNVGRFAYIPKGSTVMKISFFGHRTFVNNKGYENAIFDIFNKIKNNEHIEILLGGYGNFDKFALNCAQKLKNKHPNLSITKVVPYLNTKAIEGYDLVLYPSLENVPRKYAIIHRNQKMIEESDIIIAYIDHSFGGAYEAIKYAKRKNKTIINIADFEI